MGSYSFHYLANGRIIKSEEKQVPDDLDAVDLAEKLSIESDIIVWSGYRYVARVKKTTHPSPRVIFKAVKSNSDYAASSKDAE